jgi:hypothetical protein
MFNQSWRVPVAKKLTVVRTTATVERKNRMQRQVACG